MSYLSLNPDHTDNKQTGQFYYNTNWDFLTSALGEIMNVKLILVGGIVFYAAQMIVSFATGPLLHEGILDEVYKAYAQFWRPELTQEPPDMAALMPRWITTGLITAFLMAAVYGWIRPAFAGSGWQKGLKFGLVLFVFATTMMAGLSGIFNLPDKIWAWWTIDYLLFYAAGGAALGFVAEKLAPSAS